MTEETIKTKNVNLIASAVQILEGRLNKDYQIPRNRYDNANLMFGVQEGMGYGESVLARLIRKKGYELEIEPLDEGHPQREEEVEEYKAKVQEVISFLKSTLPDDYIDTEEDKY